MAETISTAAVAAAGASADGVAGTATAEKSMIIVLVPSNRKRPLLVRIIREEGYEPCLVHRVADVRSTLAGPSAVRVQAIFMDSADDEGQTHAFIGELRENSNGLPAYDRPIIGVAANGADRATQHQRGCANTCDPFDGTAVRAALKSLAPPAP